VNDFIRQRLRRLRLSKNVGLRELAERAGIPSSSYASMETGAYRLNLESLFRVLGALEADITAVWPSEAVGTRAEDSELLYLRRLQEFRLGEVIRLSQAEGGALFEVRERSCRIVIDQNLSDFLIDRCLVRLENGDPPNQGLWWHQDFFDTTFHFFLKAEGCPSYVEKLVQHYMVNWCALFAEESGD
jgi:transcriptional regulator with XRE-family HTH domain